VVVVVVLEYLQTELQAVLVVVHGTQEVLAQEHLGREIMAV
jgi:hypothetical protein